MLADFGPFLAISALIIVVPGPDTAVVTRNVLLGGRRSGIFTSAGVVLGLATWSVAASVGVAALLRASEPAFLALKLAGGAYLVYLGATSLLAAARRAPGPVGPGAGERRRPAGRTALRQGLLSDLGNPKIAVFFTSFLPQFVPQGQASFGVLLLLGAVFCALTLSWLVAYSAVVARAGDVLRRSRVRRALDGFTGLVLVGFGIRLATEPR